MIYESVMIILNDIANMMYEQTKLKLNMSKAHIVMRVSNGVHCSKIHTYIITFTIHIHMIKC